MGLREFGVLGQGHPGGEWQGRDVRAGSRLGSGPRPQLWPRRPGGGGEARSGPRAVSCWPSFCCALVYKLPNSVRFPLENGF